MMERIIVALFVFMLFASALMVMLGFVIAGG